MNNKKIIKLAILIVIIALCNVLVFKKFQLENKNITLSFKVISNEENTYQFFYDNNAQWKEENSQKTGYSKIGKQENIKFTIPNEIKNIRLDFGDKLSELKISDLSLNKYGKKINLDSDRLLNQNNQNDINILNASDNELNLIATGNDPYIVYEISSSEIESLNSNMNLINNILKLFICVAIDLVAVVFIKKSRSILGLINELKNNRRLIWNLSKNDFKTKYAGSYLGITWAFVQPIITIIVYWFVFEYGLKSGSPIKDVPFILWFMSGLVPWFFFQEALLNATNCMVEYSYLVKKVVFKISILPIVKIIAALFVHLVFIGFLFIVGSIYGFYPSIYTFQIVYYSFCTFFIVLSLSYVTSAIVIFFKDLGQIINILLQIGMWMTPIMWSYTIVPERYQWIVKLNPIYYIVEGYRDTFINKVWFFEHYFQTAYFWIISLILFVIGTIIFKKLKPHFADVL
ncbi:MAG: ABC transporter permease [Clostridium sp.]